ncbi:Agd3-related carbohydrate-binding protein [Longispora urticae]
MKYRMPGRSLPGRIILAVALVGSVAVVSGTVTTAQAAPGHTDDHRHSVIRADAARPQVKTPEKLPVRNGPLSTAAPRAAAALAPTDKVALRALVIAVDAGDFGAATWKSSLDQIGAPYDLLYARNAPLGALTRPDGTGKYNAVLLTNNALLYNDNGNYVSALDPAEWTALWEYEKAYKVRQVSLYTSYGTYPESYCLTPVSEGGIGDTPQNAVLTTAGAPIFDYLKAAANIPISLSYVYRTSVTPNCAATPILTLGGSVIGVTSTTADGRERLALTFTSNQYLIQANLLTYGLLRWASKGVFLGEQRHWLNVDVDDWFNNGDVLQPDGTVNSDPGYRMNGTDVTSTKTQQASLRSTYPLAAGFELNVPFNGEGIQPGVNVACLIILEDALTGQSRCNKDDFRWVNHTLTHPKMNATDYNTSLAEIQSNLTAAAQIGLAVPTTVLKTPEYSGLGVYHPDPNNDIDPPTDYGLGASNVNLLAAAKAAGVKYLHGNMSFASQKPACFNCGIYHPLEPSLLIVPDWPTNIAYHVTNPAQETQFYNSYYGPQGKFPYWPVNQTYDQIIGHESDVALQHVMTGSAYSHTVHQNNLRQYAANKNLTFDWLRAVAGKYSTYYNVPLRNPDWVALAGYVADRTAHFGSLSAGNDAVWDRATNQVTFTGAGPVFATGVRAAGFDAYGTDSISKVPTATVLTAYPKP